MLGGSRILRCPKGIYNSIKPLCKDKCREYPRTYKRRFLENEVPSSVRKGPEIRKELAQLLCCTRSKSGFAFSVLHQPLDAQHGGNGNELKCTHWPDPAQCCKLYRTVYKKKKMVDDKEHLWR